MAKATSLPRSRKDFLRRLYENEKYKQALAQARTPAERRLVAALVTDFVGGWADILAPIIDQAQRDPAFAERLGRAVNGQRGVVTGSEPAPSGSSG